MSKSHDGKQRIPIPDDWNGEDWFCIQLKWPASPQFVSVLTGLLSQVTRGWFWNEQTGTVKTAQEIGIEIWNRNIGFTPCEECEDTPNEPVPDNQIWSPGNDEEEDEMPSVTWLAIEDGQLYMYFGPCCKILVGGDYTSLIDPPPEGETTDPDDPATWSCNKSAGIAEYLWQLMGELDAALSGFSSVYAAFQAAHNVLSSHNSTWQTSQLVASAYFADKTGVQAMIADTDTPGYLACTWANLLADTDTVNESEFYIMQTNAPPSFTSAQALFMLRMLQAVGVSTLAWWARLTYDNPADCTCPDYDPLVDWPSTYDWVVDFRFDQGQPYGIQFRNDNGQSGMVEGGLTMLTNTTGSETLGAWRPPTVETGYVNAYHIQWYMGLAFNAADWGINGDIVGEAELKYQVVDDGGNNYHITKTGVNRLLSNVGGSSFGLSSFQGNYDDTKNPKFPVVTRIVIAGSGAHPYGA